MTKASARSGSYCGPATPNSPFESFGLGWSDFARHYFRNHGCFLLLRVLRWFTSPSSPVHPMDSDARNECSHSLGFPIRISPDHSLLAAPRSFSQLIASFIAYLRQGIHTHALSSLTIKSTSHTQLPASLSPPAFTRLKNSTGHLTQLTLLSLRLHLNLCLYARQYSVVKDLDCLQQSVNATRPLQIAVLFLGCRTARLGCKPGAWWAWVELNHRPHPYQGCALAI